MTPEQFRDLVTPITSRIQGRALDAKLDAELNAAYPPGGAEYKTLFEACRKAIEAGWMCNREAAGIRFGRIVKPAEAHGFSVDVVDMNSIAGPHHRHPNGEIDMIMPLDASAKFDGRGAGWLVYGPDTAHSPTVSGGRALVLYLLPGGAIEFSK